MNNNEISNPKTEVSKGIKLNDKDYLNSLLTHLKEMEKNYTISMTEASNEHLYNEYLKTFERISEMQRETYELMFKNGWYNLEKAQQNKVNKKLNILNKEYTDLNG